MSAFLVESKTINKILTQVAIEVKKSAYCKEQFENTLKTDFDTSDWQTKLGQKMLELNQLSLGHRYGDAQEHLTYVYHPELCSHIEAFKALQCWLYQCMEGDIPEQSKLFKFFKKVIIPNWAISIVMNGSLYDEAEWG